MKFNEKHGILFNQAPPVEWTNFDGIMYIGYEYHNNSVEYSPEYHKGKVKHIYDGNYNKLHKFVFNH